MLDKGPERRDIYSLFADSYTTHNGTYDVPLFRYVGKGKVEIVFTHRKDKDAMKIQSRKLPKGFIPSLFGLKKGDFCNDYGCKLPDDLAQVAKDVFHQVEVGIEILPDPSLYCGSPITRYVSDMATE